MMGAAAGAQLAQVRPAGTTAVNLFTALMQTEITNIVLANVTSGAIVVSLFHDDDGSTFDQTTALYYQVTIAANSTLEIEANCIGAGFHMQKEGQLGIQVDTANALNATVYGLTARIQERVR